MSDLSEEQIFEKCLELPPEEREAFLDEMCADNPQLRSNVESLLRSHEAPGGFLDSLPLSESFDPDFKSDRLAASEERAGDQIGRYRLVELLGEGSWGSVWLAEQTEDIERKVALKILKLGFDTKDFLTRFNAERQILAMMSHPYIAMVLDSGSTDLGRPYLVMEYVQGSALLDYANEKRMTLEARLRLFINICEALQHAHQKGIIHRDVKPSNVLVTEEEGKPIPKVIDFGVAKNTRFRLPDNSHLTNIHTFIGTPVYCSPEQLDRRNRDIDHRSDLYSLGAILYELLCFQTPFDLTEYSEMGIEEFRSLVREQVPVKPSARFAALSSENRNRVSEKLSSTASQVEARLRGELDWIIMKCLESDPTRRYESVQGMVDDLQAYLQNRPISAEAPSPLYRIRKYLTRKRTTYAMFLEVALILVILLGGILILTRKPDDLGIEPSLSLTKHSVAMLPVENLSSEAQYDYLAQGIHEGVLNGLSGIADLRVISRSSTEVFRDSELTAGQIASELGARYLVTGSVRKEGEKITVDIRLIDPIASDEAWTKTYENASNDVLSIQSAIAKDLATQMRVQLSTPEIARIERRPTQNQEAYQQYQMARFLSENTYEGVPRIAQFEKVVSIDPTFAEAWAELAIECIRWWELAKLRKDTHLQAKAHRALEEATRWGPELPDIPYAQSSFSFHEDQDLRSSIEFLLTALDIDPQFSQARLHLSERYFALGDLDKALAELIAVKQVDPKSPVVDRELFVLYQADRQWEPVHEMANRYLASDPQHERWRRRLAQNNFFNSGNSAAFSDEIFQIKEFAKTPRGQVWLSLLARDFERALHFLEDLEDVHAWEAFNYILGVDLGFNFSPVAVLIAMVAAETGDREKALYNSRRATEMMEALLRGDPQFDPQFWSNLVICYALQGELEKMEAIIPKIRAATSRPFWKYKRAVACELRIAIAYLLLGNRDQALEIMTAAHSEPSPLVFEQELQLWYVFDTLRGDERFEALLKVH